MPFSWQSRLRAEALEQKVLLAVDVSVIDGDLVLVASEEATPPSGSAPSLDDAVLVEVGSQEFIITPGDQTLVNGASDPIVVLREDVTGDVRIDLGDGQNSLEIAGVLDVESGDPTLERLPGDLIVATGVGRDFVVVERLDVVGDIDIDVAGVGEGDVTEGDNAVFIQFVIAEDVRVTTGEGNDEVGIFGEGSAVVDGSGEEPPPARGGGLKRLASKTTSSFIREAARTRSAYAMSRPASLARDRAPNYLSHGTVLIDAGAGNDFVGIEELRDLPQFIEGQQVLANMVVRTAGGDDLVQVVGADRMTIDGGDELEADVLNAADVDPASTFLDFESESDDFFFDCDGIRRRFRSVDLAVAKTVDNSTPDVGQSITFTISVENLAAFQSATNVSIFDLIDTAGVEIISISESQGGYSTVDRRVERRDDPCRPGSGAGHYGDRERGNRPYQYGQRAERRSA